MENFVEKFIKKYEGVGIDPDNAFGNQCVDVIKQVLRDLGQPIVRTGSAYEIWTKETLKKYYTKIADASEVSAGDIAVWRRSTSKQQGLTQFGHVALVTSINDKENRFEVIEQQGGGLDAEGNWPDVKCIISTYSFNDHRLLGFLRLKDQYRPKDETVSTKDVAEALGYDQEVDMTILKEAPKPKKPKKKNKVLAGLKQLYDKYLTTKNQKALAEMTLGELNAKAKSTRHYQKGREYAVTSSITGFLYVYYDNLVTNIENHWKFLEVWHEDLDKLFEIISTIAVGWGISVGEQWLHDKNKKWKSKIVEKIIVAWSSKMHTKSVLEINNEKIRRGEKV